MASAGENTVVAGHDYSARTDKEISFKRGQRIVVLERQDSGWWLGEAEGRRGLFPSTYVRELSPSPAVAPAQSNTATLVRPQGPPSGRPAPPPTLRPTSAGPYKLRPVTAEVKTIAVVRAIYDFVGDGEKKLTLKKGEHINVTQKLQEVGWWEGELNGKVGLFPSNYVEEIKRKDTADSPEKPNSPREMSASGEESKASESGAQVLMAICLYDFVSEEEKKLPLKKGEKVEVISRASESWWKGRIETRVGYFPSSYVRLIESTAVAATPVQPAPAAVPIVTRGAAPPIGTLRPFDLNAAKEDVSGKSAIALYDYIARNDSELSFVKGDRIKLLDELSINWYKGEKGGKIGRFPKNYVRLDTAEAASTSATMPALKNSLNADNPTSGDTAEKERQEKEKLDSERLQREKAERAARMERERQERENREKAERELKERMERARQERERMDKERQERERERAEKERAERERLAKEKAERERQAENERLEKEREEKERLEKARLEKERLEKERLEKERLEKERLEKERLEKERLEKERLEREKAEREAKAAEQAERERKEKEDPAARERERRAREDEAMRIREREYAELQRRRQLEAVAEAGAASASTPPAERRPASGPSFRGQVGYTHSYVPPSPSTSFAGGPTLLSVPPTIGVSAAAQTPATVPVAGGSSSGTGEITRPRVNSRPLPNPPRGRSNSSLRSSGESKPMETRDRDDSGDAAAIRMDAAAVRQWLSQVEDENQVTTFEQLRRLVFEERRERRQMAQRLLSIEERLAKLTNPT